VLGHGHGLGARLGQPPAGLAVQGQPHAGREVIVDGLVDEVVAEAEPVAVVFDDAGPQRLGQHRRQLQDRPAGGRRQVGEREARPQDGGRAQRLQGVVGKEAEAAQDGEPQAGRQGRLGHLGPPVGDLDGPLVQQRSQQLGDEQRVAAGRGHLGHEPGPGLGADGPGHQLGHGAGVELAQGQAARPGGVQGLQRPLQLRPPGQRPQAGQQRHRAAGEPPGQRAQGQQAGGVGPLEVVEAEHQRPAEGQRLHQLQEGVDGLELQARVAAHGGHAAVAVVGGQQGGDGGPARVRGRPRAAEAVGQQAEGPVALQVLAPPGHDLQAALTCGLQRLGKQAGLADPGLAFDDHDGRSSPRRPTKGVDERP
jgi:hypothetical protein